MLHDSHKLLHAMRLFLTTAACADAPGIGCWGCGNAIGCVGGCHMTARGIQACGLFHVHILGCDDGASVWLSLTGVRVIHWSISCDVLPWMTRTPVRDSHTHASSSLPSMKGPHQHIHFILLFLSEDNWRGGGGQTKDYSLQDMQIL